MAGKYYEGIGRRKTSSARVRLHQGEGASTVNDVPVDEYFNDKKSKRECSEPLKLVELDKKYHFTAVVSGGGVTGQVGAIQLGVGRALLKIDETLKPALRKAGFVTRDPRMVERKKYHRRKARKQPQFSKR